MTPHEAVKILDANIALLPPREERGPLDLGYVVPREIAQGVFDYVNELIPNKAPEVAEVGINFTWRGVHCLVGE